MMKLMKPAIVLTTITTLIAALLIVTYKLTYVDTSNMITAKLQASCETVMGAGEYAIVADWKKEGYSIDKPENIEKLIKKSDGTLAFEIIADGYEKGGLDILVAINADGSVKNLTVISSAETPGLGSKTSKRNFLDNFVGVKSAKIVKGAAKNDGEISAITSATYSSKGVAKAVNLALQTYKEMGGIK